MEKQWKELSLDEKQEEMFQKWLTPQGLEFASPETEKSYKARVTRIKDAIQLKKVPDRVPVIPTTGFFPCYHAGITPQDMMYDYDKLYMAFKKYTLDFEPDAHLGLFHAGPGKIFDILDYKILYGRATELPLNIHTNILRENMLRRMNMMLLFRTRLISSGVSTCRAYSGS